MFKHASEPKLPSDRCNLQKPIQVTLKTLNLLCIVQAKTYIAIICDDKTIRPRPIILTYFKVIKSACTLATIKMPGRRQTSISSYLEPKEERTNCCCESQKLTMFNSNQDRYFSTVRSGCSLRILVQTTAKLICLGYNCFAILT